MSSVWESDSQNKSFSPSKGLNQLENKNDKTKLQEIEKEIENFYENIESMIHLLQIELKLEEINNPDYVEQNPELNTSLNRSYSNLSNLSNLSSSTSGNRFSSMPSSPEHDWIN